jgi:ribonuclease HI
MEYLDERDINIFTDGSAYGRPRRGGIGVRFVTVDTGGEEHIEDYPLPGTRQATNQQMELQACIEALHAVATRRAPIQDRDYRRIVIWTDSQYVVDNYVRALFDWQSNRWMTNDGNPVANAPQWKELLKAAHRAGHRVELKWIKGHKHSTHNKAVDKLAKASALGMTGAPLAVVKVRRKKSERATEVGSVGMHGQRTTIRIIEDRFERLSRMNRYRYEVVSTKSEFRGYVDFIFSDESLHLSAGHTYYVQVNDQQSRPRVIKMFREVIDGGKHGPRSS